MLPARNIPYASKKYIGLVVPIPTLPAGLMIIAVAPVDVWALKTFPVLNCCTVNAFPVVELPVTNTFEATRLRGWVGAP